MPASEYKGSVTLISGLTQKNNGDFPLLDASQVQYKTEEGSSGGWKSIEEKIDEIAEATGNPDVMTDEELNDLWDSIFGTQE